MRMIRIFAALMALILMGSAPAAAMEKIDTERNVQLTIDFRYNGVPIAGARFDIHRVALVDQNGKLTAAAPFDRYKVDVNADSESELRKIASTFEGLVLRDDVQPTDSGLVGSTGSVRFPSAGKKMRPGLYLVLAQLHTDSGRIYHVQPTLVQLPAPNADNTGWIYDLEIKPKYDAWPDVPNPDPLTRKVLKVWKNTENVDLPDEITVHLLQDGDVFDTVRLNAENLWRHTWDELDTLHHWTVVEEPLDDYSVTVSREGVTFVVTNTYDPDEPGPTTKPDDVPTPTPKPTSPPGSKPPGSKLPQTGQLWWPVPMLASAGLLLIVIGLIRRRGH